MSQVFETIAFGRTPTGPDAAEQAAHVPPVQKPQRLRPRTKPKAEANLAPRANSPRGQKSQPQRDAAERPNRARYRMSLPVG